MGKPNREQKMATTHIRPQMPLWAAPLHGTVHITPLTVRRHEDYCEAGVRTDSALAYLPRSCDLRYSWPCR